MLNPNHLRTLQECIRTGSFAEAGRSLGYTASAVSQQMLLLERAVGASLFERCPRSTRHTGLAAWLAEHSRAALAALDALEAEVQSMRGGDRGSLRLASFSTANVGILPEVLSGVVAERPDAEVQLVEGEPDDVLGKVLAGDVDLALVFEYDLDPREWPPGLTVVDLLAEPMRLLLPKGHPRRRSPRIALKDLADATWISTRDDTAGSRSFVRLAAAAGFIPRVVFQTNDYAVIRDLVARGLGIAVVPWLAVNDDDVLVVPLTGPRFSRHVKALYRAHNPNPLLAVALEQLTTATAGVIDEPG